MGDKLTCIQILQLALDKEKQAFEFYTNAAKLVNDPNGKMLFELFAAEEQKHIARLEFELIKSGKTTEANHEMLTFEDLDFVIDVTEEIKGIYMDILAGAIQKERESFKFFINLLPLVESEEPRKILEALIEEEVRHKILLETKYNRASAT